MLPAPRARPAMKNAAVERPPTASPKASGRAAPSVVEENAGEGDAAPGVMVMAGNEPRRRILHSFASPAEALVAARYSPLSIADFAVNATQDLAICATTLS